MNIETSKIKIMYEHIIKEIKLYAQKNNNSKVVLGLSGGIDSALVATLLVHALGAHNVLGVLMPSGYSTSHSLTDARELAFNLDIHTIETPIETIYTSYINTITNSINNSNLDKEKKDKLEVFDLAYENIQSRIRANILMFIANKYGNMLMNTGNKSEASMGYCTLYGDLCGMLSPIGDLYKLEVFAMAQFINSQSKKCIIPKNSIEKEPSAELRDNQIDSDSLPKYDILDYILEDYIEFNLDKEKLISKYNDENLIDFIIDKYKKSEFKRKLAPKVIELRSLI